jgi:hypothetical protein
MRTETLIPLEKLMLCSVCKSPLEPKGTFIADDVMGPKVEINYTCTNTECLSHTVKGCWGSSGDFYCQDYSSYSALVSKFINNTTAALNSIARQLEVEIYKHDEDFDLFTVGRLTVRIYFKYTADRLGIVLSKKPRIRLLMREKNGITQYWYTPKVITWLRRMKRNAIR